jgi:hypothetical protein
MARPTIASLRREAALEARFDGPVPRDFDEADDTAPLRRRLGAMSLHLDIVARLVRGLRRRRPASRIASLGYHVAALRRVAGAIGA